jgi:hypothetical protein
MAYRDCMYMYSETATVSEQTIYSTPDDAPTLHPIPKISYANVTLC